MAAKRRSVMLPLTDEQKERAGRDPAWRIPFALAERHCRGDANLRSMMQEAAVDAYVRLARCFDPARHKDGESGWQPYAWHWTKRQMLHNVAARLRRERGQQRRPLDCPEAESLCDPAPPALDRLVRAEEAALVLAAVPLIESGNPTRQREALAHLLAGRNGMEAGAIMGVCRQRISQMAAKARKKAKRAMAARAATGRA